MEERFFTATDIKHFTWCEAIIYVKYFLGFSERTTESMEYGSEVEKERHIATLARKYSASKVIKQPELINAELELSGKPDYVIITKYGEAIPAEIKWSEPTPRETPKRDHLMQLAAYAVLIETSWREAIKTSVKRGVIYYLRPEGRLVEVQLNYSLKRGVIKTLKKMKDVATGLREPKPSTWRCVSCGFRPYCPYAKR